LRDFGWLIRNEVNLQHGTSFPLYYWYLIRCSCFLFKH